MSYIVYNHGSQKWGIPFSLIERQKVEFEDLTEIVSFQKQRHDLKEFLSTATDPQLKEIASKQITDIEYSLQILWGFPTDFNYHKHWTVPGCKCPQMDNRDNYPYGAIISGGCELHAYLLK